MILSSKQSEKKLPWALAATFYGLKTVGLAPLSHQVIKNGHSFHCSKIGSAYNIFLLIVLHCVNLLTFYTTHGKLGLSNKQVVTKIINMVRSSISFLTLNVIVVCMSFRQKNAASIVNRLIKIDRLIDGVEKPPHGKRVFKFFALHATISAFLWIPSRITGVWLNPNTLAWFSYSVSILVIYLFISEYFLALGLVAEGLERVNKNLSKLKELNHRRFIADFIPISNYPTKAHVYSVKLLLEIRGMLYEVSKDLESFFSLPILFSVSCYFLLLIFTVYFFIAEFLLKIDDSECLGQRVVSHLSAVLLNAYPLTVLSFVVTKAVKEAELTGWIVHKLMATPNMQELKIELRSFSLKLLHENVSFTGYNLFSLKCTLLHSMLEAVVVYLIVIFQFDN